MEYYQELDFSTMQQFKIVEDEIAGVKKSMQVQIAKLSNWCFDIERRLTKIEERQKLNSKIL